MTIWRFLLCALGAAIGASAADIPFAWDYAATNPPATFLLLGPQTVIPTPLKAAVATNIPPGFHDFRAAATNDAGGATSAPVRVGVVKVTIERAGSPTGPWTTDTLYFRSYPLGPSNGFFRARMDWQP